MFPWPYHIEDISREMKMPSAILAHTAVSKECIAALVRTCRLLLLISGVRLLLLLVLVGAIFAGHPGGGGVCMGSTWAAPMPWTGNATW